MNPLPEPDELLEAECNALGFYGLPEPLVLQPREAHRCAEVAAGHAESAPPPGLSGPWRSGSPR